MGNKFSTAYIVLNETNTLKNLIQYDPIELSNNMQKLILKLKAENLMDDSSVNYSKLIQSSRFNDDYIELAQRLQQADLNKLDSDANLKAFFINVYNSLTIHAISYLCQNSLKQTIENKSPQSMLSALGGQFWSRFAYNINGHDFSLDDIEHGVLRSNKNHPSALFNLLMARRMHRQMFTRADPRLKYVVKQFDPRIHFALNCGATSCPPISVYTPNNVECGLEAACVSFINSSETLLDTDGEQIQLSSLFKWYKSDFCAEAKENSLSEDQKMLKFVAKYLQPNESTDVNKFRELIDQNNMKIKFAKYNWTMNISFE